MAVTYGAISTPTTPSGNWANTLQTAGEIGYNALNQPNAEDPRRFTEGQTWYRAAISGDQAALCTLQHMTGNFGCETCGQYGNRCGHATAIAKAYDLTLYNQALRVLNGSIPASTPIPAPPSASGANAGTIATIGQTAGTIADVAGGVATGVGYPTTQWGSPTQTRATIDSAMWLALALVGGVLVYFFLKR